MKRGRGGERGRDEEGEGEGEEKGEEMKRGRGGEVDSRFSLGDQHNIIALKKLNKTLQK